MGKVASRWMVMGVLALLGPEVALADEGSASGDPGSVRICPTATEAAGVVICFGDDGIATEEQGSVEQQVRTQLDALANEGLGPSGTEQLLVRIDGAQPNLVFHVEPMLDDGVPLPGWEKVFDGCHDERGCTDAEWHEVIWAGMREALVDLRRSRETATDPAAPADPADPIDLTDPSDPGAPSEDPGPPIEPRRYRPKPLGVAGIVTASLGGAGLMTGAALMLVGGVPDTAGPGLRQDRELLPYSRDFYTPGAVTLGASAAAVSAGLAMVIVDRRRWKAREGAPSTSGHRTRLRLTASPWGRGVRLTGRF